MIPARRRLAVVALLAITLALLGAGRASALPALWVVESPTAKVYLFGTVHALKPGMSWRSSAVDAAISESQDLWIEVADAGDVPAVVRAVKELGFDPSHPLSTKISHADAVALDGRAKEIGLPGESRFEPMRPWLVTLTLSACPIVHAGYSAAGGVDLSAKSIFTAANKPVRGFETIDQQLHFLADVPEAEQVAQLHAILSGAASKAATMTVVDQIVAAWYGGDVERLASYADAYAKYDPTFSNTILAQRNASWATEIVERLARPGVSFVAVGAMHLAGAQSLLADLEKLGYRARRLQ